MEVGADERLLAMTGFGAHVSAVGEVGGDLTTISVSEIRGSIGLGDGLILRIIFSFEGFGLDSFGCGIAILRVLRFCDL